MYQFDSHHLAPPFAPVSWCGKQWIHTVDPVEDSSNKEGFKYRKRGQFPFKKRGAEATQKW